MRNLFLLATILLIGCSGAVNPSRYGYDGEADISPREIAISPNIGIEKDDLEVLSKFKMKNIPANKIMLDMTKNFRARFIEDAVVYRIGNATSGGALLSGASDLEDFIQAFGAFDDANSYTLLPYGVTKHKGRTCILLLLDMKFKPKQEKNTLNIDLRGAVKGYQLIDVNSGLKVAMSLRFSMNAGDNLIMTCDVSEELL